MYLYGLHHKQLKAVRYEQKWDELFLVLVTDPNYESMSLWLRATDEAQAASVDTSKALYILEMFYNAKG